MSSLPTAGPTGTLPIPRGPSAQSVLKLAWEYPVVTGVPGPETGEERTVARQQSVALDAKEALARLAGDDPRPLLVLRECKVCNGTDDALLSRGEVDNEKTFLLSRWFHCVKLPVDVLQEDHPFHNLFLPANDAPHLFLCAQDGSERIVLESERSRTELWGAMTKVLETQYKGGPDGKLSEMAKAIDRLDLVDTEVFQLEKEIDATLEQSRSDGRQLKKLRAKLEAAKEERDELLSTIDEATQALKLKKVAAASASKSGP